MPIGGNALRVIEHIDEALACYDRAIALSPGYAEAYSNRGWVLADVARLDEALICLDKAIALDPDHVRAHWNKSLALLKQGKLQPGVAPV